MLIALACGYWFIQLLRSYCWENPLSTAYRRATVTSFAHLPWA